MFSSAGGGAAHQDTISWSSGPTEIHYVYYTEDVTHYGSESSSCSGDYLQMEMFISLTLGTQTHLNVLHHMVNMRHTSCREYCVFMLLHR